MDINTNRKCIYICSPCRGDYEGNLKRAREYCRDVALRGYIPIAPHVYCTQFLDDMNRDEREIGLAYGLELLTMCDELWVYDEDRLSEGMNAEIELAEQLGIPIRAGIGANRDDCS